jgi:nucleolar protein 9
MPREHRKRGKRKKNAGEHDVHPEEEQEPKEVIPSWIEPATPQQLVNPDAPFGFCEPDVKAYFRTVDKQLREWQELGIAERESDAVEDPNMGTSIVGWDKNDAQCQNFSLSTERRMFFAAALGEMQGKERQLATDPDCAVILERMIYSMDDLARRIFANSLAGS